MTENQKLLREYADNGSETAFRELVSRYIDLVYSTAIRQVAPQTHLAEDVVQSVFVDLARMAPKLSPDVMLGGWLHRHTCYVVANMLRAERRRQNWEKQAVEMNALNEPSEGAWKQAAPDLDAAIDQLQAEDRVAILLRFFEQRDLRSVGQELGISEDAAQKRVTRALEKLRLFLSRRGLTLSATTLAAALASEAITAAPVGLAASVASVALASSATATGITLAFLKAITMANLKHIALSGLVLATAITPVLVEQRRHHRLLDEQGALRRQVQQVRSLEAENEQLRKASRDPADLMALRREHQERQAQRSELMRLRSQVGRAQREAIERASRSQRRKAQLQAMQRLAWTNIPPNEIRRFPMEKRLTLTALQNLGAATPEAALESYLWAVQQQDVEAWLNLQFTPEYRAAFGDGMKMDQFENRLVKEKQTLDGITSIQLRLKEKYGEDQVNLIYEFKRERARQKDEPTGGSLGLKKVGDEWKTIVVGLQQPLEPRPRTTPKP